MRHDELTLDSRDQEDLRRRIAALAASYTPEWRFDGQDPDVGSTLALLYAEQMADNIRRLNRLPEKYHTELVNLLGLSLQPSAPASGTAVVELLRGTVPGVALPRGSRLLADGEDGEPILFETVGDVYVTNARITDVLSLSGREGRIYPLLGGPAPARLVPGASEEEPAEAPEPPAFGGEEFPAAAPFALFDYGEPGVEKNAVLLYHRCAFGAEGDISVQIAVTGEHGESLAGLLADDRRWRWSYYSDNGLTPFSEVSAVDGLVVLRREEPSQTVNLDGIACHLICLEALEPVREAITVTDIRAASERPPAPPERILHNGEELEAAECMPFGETVSLFDECYLCDDQAFAQEGAEITLSFRLSSRKKMLRLTARQESDELKVIKRKPRNIQYDTVLTSPQRVALEYFDGRAWKRLPASQEWGGLWDGSHSGDFEITFPCPEDWRGGAVDGYEGRTLRLRVIQADDCYLLPCEHTMPVLRDLKVSYVYRGTWKQPQRLRTVCGTVVSDRSRALLQGGPVTVFQPLPYPEASLYLGFDRPLEGAPVSILFDVEENVRFRMEPVTFEYSTRGGFRQMKVVDGTGNFSGPGSVLFMPPPDFAAAEVEGVRRWWLRLRGPGGQGYHARVRRIYLNAVDIRGQQTLEEETFYADPGTGEFPLAGDSILSADVYVDESGRLSRAEMRTLLEERPGDVRAEYDSLGNTAAFFVRWTEAADNGRTGTRQYRIDRGRNVLAFDGPQPPAGAEISVRAIRCAGARGNVPAGAVNRFFGNVMYVQSVYNPLPACAGGDQENLDGALRRGADLLAGRGRLISEADFARAALAFSGTVEKAKCLAGRDIDGRPAPERITLAVMTRDYGEGGRAFGSLREPLRRRLLEGCEASLAPEGLIVSEPVYVEISVSVWVKVSGSTRSFQIQRQIQEAIRDFLDPMPGERSKGWEIGVLPTEGQLKMLLQSLRFPGHVGRMIASARYVDRNGAHETGLDRLPGGPFAIGVSGEHHVYIEFQ